ncbi:MAG: hypothetical protein ACETWQ_13855, partial [Phycisphaerae bacterium]
FRKKLIFIRTRYRQNQRSWRHSGDTMSPEKSGCFLAPERGDFSENSDLLQLVGRMSFVRAHRA